MTKKKVKTIERYLIKKSDKLFLVPVKTLEELGPVDAFQVAVDSHFAQRHQLVLDATKGDHFVDDLKVVDGLEASLRKFEALYPSIKEHLKYIDNSSKYSKIGKS